MLSPAKAPSTESPVPTPIALFVGSYLTYSETFIYDQIKHQRKTKCQVLAYASHPDRKLFPYPDVTHLEGLEKIAYLTVGRSRTFSRVLREYQPKLIHAHFGPNGALALPFAKQLGIPLVVTFHGHDVGGLLGGNKYSIRYARYNVMAKRMFDYASLILPASQDLAETLLRNRLVSEQKIKVHPLGIDVDTFGVMERSGTSKNILMVGRLVEKKGFQYGITAFSECLKRHQDAHLHLVGDGPLGERLKQMAHTLALSKQVTFHGKQNAQQLRKLMQKMDFLVAPSFTTARGDKESGILVIKEANATGMPAIGTRHGGIPEIIEDAKSGYLVPEKSVPALVAKMNELLSEPDRRLEMGRRARKKTEDSFNTRTQNRLLEDHLLSVL